MNDTFPLEGDGPLPDCQVTMGLDGGLIDFYVSFDPETDEISVSLPSDLSESDTLIASGVLAQISASLAQSLIHSTGALQ